jgi:hypothetical protein
VASFTLRQLYPRGKTPPPVLTGQEVGWTPEPVRTLWRRVSIPRAISRVRCLYETDVSRAIAVVVVVVVIIIIIIRELTRLIAREDFIE